MYKCKIIKLLITIGKWSSYPWCICKLSLPVIHLLIFCPKQVFNSRKLRANAMIGYFKVKVFCTYHIFLYKGVDLVLKILLTKVDGLEVLIINLPVLMLNPRKAIV